MIEEDSQRAVKPTGAQESQPEASAEYDSYQSVADSNFVIFVPKDSVPPFRFKAGGWELLQTSIELTPGARARIAEEGYFIENCTPVGSGEVIPGDYRGPAETSLEVEFALVIARMIDSAREHPEDLRHAIYNLARYKLQEQLPHASAGEREHTRQALEVAIRGVEAFSEKHAEIRPLEHRPQLSDPGAKSADYERVVRSASSLRPAVIPQARPTPRLGSERNAGDSKNKSRLSHLRQTAVMIIILIAILVVTQQRERFQQLTHNLPIPEWKAPLEEHSAPPLPSSPVVSAPPPTEFATLRPRDYGVYAVSNDALFDLGPLPGRPPDIRIAVSAVLTTPSRTIIPSGHPKFIVFSPDIGSSITDRPEVRVIAKIAREFSATVVGKQTVDDRWVIRNISFPFRSSPVDGNPEMYELHSEDPALELTPGRYALVLKNQAYDFSVDGKVVDPRQCIERIVGPTGIFYSDCKNP